MSPESKRLLQELNLWHDSMELWADPIPYREHYRPEKLREAGNLLIDAAKQVQIVYPHSAREPNPDVLPAALAMIRSALRCISAFYPTAGSGARSPNPTEGQAHKDVSV